MYVCMPGLSSNKLAELDNLDNMPYIAIISYS